MQGHVYHGSSKRSVIYTGCWWISSIRKSAACGWVGHSILGPRILHFIFLMGMLESQRALQIPIINSRNYSLGTSTHIWHCWISNSPCGFFPISRARTEGHTQAASSPWLLMTDPYLPVKSQHCGTRRATSMVALAWEVQWGVFWAKSPCTGVSRYSEEK